uniref:Uncharacterized protein n=1 Tax=Anopheles atroparvus TaxID=41427 RepID=A0A182JGY5_ANOAO
MPSSVRQSLGKVSRLTVLLLAGLWCGEIDVLLVNAQKPIPRRDQNYPPPAIIATLAPLGDECVAETGVLRTAIKRFSDEDIFEDDRNLMCYMSCMFRKSNVTDANGELHLGRLMELVPVEFEDVLLRMGIRCTKPKGKDLCERAFWFHKCWKTADPVHYYLA